VSARTSRRFIVTFVVAVLSGATAGAPAHAGEARMAWSEREHLDWFKSSASCHVQAAVDTGMGRTFTATTRAIDTRHADITLRARNVRSGHLMWRRKIDLGRVDSAGDVLAMPAAGLVLVIGTDGELTRVAAPRSMIVAAYSIRGGHLRWLRELTGPDGRAAGYSLTAAPDGSVVYAAGHAFTPESTGYEPGGRPFVLAFDPATGATVWTTTIAPAAGRRDTLPGCSTESPMRAVAATDDTVLLALRMNIDDELGEQEMGIAALDAATGALSWQRSLDGYGEGITVAVDASGSSAVLGGSSPRATIATFDVATGAPGWTARTHSGYVQYVHPTDEGRVLATGATYFARVWTGALSLTSGRVRWERTYEDLDHNHDAQGLSTSPNERRMYVATWRCVETAEDPGDPLGSIPLCFKDLAVLRYRVDDGRGGIWGIYDGPYREGTELASDIAVTRRGRVVVAGISQAGPAPNVCGRYVCRSDYDVVTVAFDERSRRRPG
jgi:outer membrane protein assembly factor BamB